MQEFNKVLVLFLFTQKKDAFIILSKFAIKLEFIKILRFYILMLNIPNIISVRVIYMGRVLIYILIPGIKQSNIFMYSLPYRLNRKIKYY